MGKIDTRAVNTAARRVSGQPEITRSEAPRFLAGTQSIRNLYLMHCGISLHSALPRPDSGARGRLMRELRATLRRSVLGLTVLPIGLQIAANFVRDTSEVPTGIPPLDAKWVPGAVAGGTCPEHTKPVLPTCP